MLDDDDIREQLDQLKREHKSVDEQIDTLSRVQPVDFLHVTKLKKEKLRLKDQIQKLESALIPDILA